MLILVFWLFLETQRAVKRERKLYGKVQHTLRAERCTYAIVSFFFALSYIGRYTINICDGDEYEIRVYSKKVSKITFLVKV